ncbi:MAG TPA: hypothetical protein VMU03_13115, partial [Gammaproteobacteria bacterium]|nr:hypothetical protein [Gammaproteobacteria bacterium]
MRSKTRATTPASGSRLLIAFATVALAGPVAAQSTEPARSNAAAASPAAPRAELAKLPGARRLRDAMADSGDFRAALNPALEAVAVQADARDAGYTSDLAVLARIEAELGEFDKAEANYLRVIDALQAAGGEY